MTINTTKPNEANSETGLERRAFHRAMLEISGCLSDGVRKLNCIVLDLSLGGTMVKIDTDAISEISPSKDMGEELIVTLEIAAPVLFAAKVVWRGGSILGLKFLQAPDEVANGLENLLSPECFKGLAGRDIPALLG